MYEVTIAVPCSGEMHWVRLQVKSWKQWEIVDTQCFQLMGKALGKMAECYHLAKSWGEIAKYSATLALKEIGPDAAPILVEALGEMSESIRDEIYKAFAEWRPQCAVPALVVHSYRFWEARDALEEYERADLPSLEEAIETLFLQGLEDVIKPATAEPKVLKAVARMGEKALPILFHRLEHPHFLGQELDFLRIFEEIGGEIALACAKHATTLDGWRVAQSGAWMLGRLGALDEVEKLLLSKEPIMREEACKVLAQYGGKKYAPVLSKIAQDPNEDPVVREVANRALQKLEGV